MTYQKPSKLLLYFNKIDHLGAFTALLCLFAFLGNPFLVVKANRITAGTGLTLYDFLPAEFAILFTAIMVLICLLMCQKHHLHIKAWGHFLSLLGLFLLAGLCADLLHDPQQPFARISFGSGFWCAFLALGLTLADNLVKMKLGSPWRLAILLITTAAFSLIIWQGFWENISLIQEYHATTSFWKQAGQHLILSLFSLLPAVIIGFPLGILCVHHPLIRHITYPILNILQTIPSLAMFGILMVVLGALITVYPFLTDYGIRGIGATPALIALFFYSLLPVVANTVIGFEELDDAIIEAAYGMGLSKWQCLFQVQIPLAMPVILTGIRITLIQNIGLVAVAGLIGGGGFGTFIFQGLGQTATELVLLGAIPTVYCSFSAAIIMDCLISGFQQEPTYD